MPIHQYNLKTPESQYLNSLCIGYSSDNIYTTFHPGLCGFRYFFSTVEFCFRKSCLSVKYVTKKIARISALLMRMEYTSKYMFYE